MGYLAQRTIGYLRRELDFEEEHRTKTNQELRIERLKNFGFNDNAIEHILKTRVTE